MKPSTLLMVPLLFAFTAAAQDDEKVGAVILIPKTLKAHIEHMPKTLPFVGETLDSCRAKVIVGSTLDAAKAEPDARFILLVHSFTHNPRPLTIKDSINRLSYSLYFRPADRKKLPVLLAKSAVELSAGDPKTDRTIFGTMAWSVGDDVADVLAPKFVDAKALPFTLLHGNAVPIKRNAFAVGFTKDTTGAAVGNLALKNKLPVKIDVYKLAFVPQNGVTGKVKVPVAEREFVNRFVEIKKHVVVEPNGTAKLDWLVGDDIGPDDRYVRMNHLQLIAPD